MRAAVIERFGEPPVVRDKDEPPADGADLIEVTAAPLNPVDLSIASGRFYGGTPPLPYVPGGEGIGTPGIAAYLAITRRAQLQPGETVLVLGASGVLGSIAVQVAKLLGAGRVIAGGRDDRGLARARELGADATVDLKQIEGLTDRIREACGGQLQVVIDPIWGAPAVAALEAMSPLGRFVQLGQSAGAEATVKSATVRGRYLSILGYGSFLVPWEDQAVAYRRLVDYAAAGKIKVEVEVLPLDAVADAWKRQATSPHRKLVLSPRIPAAS
ncbi:MAG: zinc-binding dehydrogenase [Chloroflexi bacterium]|nr:MAG: zinc-binding dehydrogenase [Chloroflexota bacterium]